MAKMWAGRTAGVTDPVADDFNSSIRFDSRMYREDITGSMAHAAMLGAQHILPQADADAIIDALQGILDDLDHGALAFDPACEDIHMFVEQVLTARIGDLGKKLHTARSRNDQVALDLRMYLRHETQDIIALTKDVLAALVEQAGAHKGDILPGYTHLQRAQPITFGHHLMAYAMMLLRDIDRMQDAVRRMNVSPIGCCALAGTTYDTDRFFEAKQLGFDDVARNSLDGVSDRDFCVELLDAYAIEMMHLSRLSEELVLWSSWEFQFVQLSDSYTTGSSIMPQKKNPWTFESCASFVARIKGYADAAWMTYKGVPYAFTMESMDLISNFWPCLKDIEGVIRLLDVSMKDIKIHKERARQTAACNFCTVTELANTLVRDEKLSFRAAHEIVAHVVGYLTENNKKATDIDAAVLNRISRELFGKTLGITDQQIQEALDPVKNANSKTVVGGTAPHEVLRQLDVIEQTLAEDENEIARHEARLAQARADMNAQVDKFIGSL